MTRRVGQSWGRLCFEKGSDRCKGACWAAAEGPGRRRAAVALTRAWVRRKDASTDSRAALLLCAQTRPARTAASKPSLKGAGLRRLCLTSPAPGPSLQETSTFLSLESLPPSQPERLWHLLGQDVSSSKCVRRLLPGTGKLCFLSRGWGWGLGGRQGPVLLRSKAFFPDTVNRRLYTLLLLRNQRRWINKWVSRPPFPEKPGSSSSPPPFLPSSPPLCSWLAARFPCLPHSSTWKNLYIKVEEKKRDSRELLKSRGS